MTGSRPDHDRLNARTTYFTAAGGRVLEQLRLIMEALPWTGPAVIGGGVFALLTMLFFPKRRSASDRVGFALFVWCLVVALVVTLSPVKNAYFGLPTSGCNLSIWRPLNHHYWLSSGSRPPNVWLLLPAGIGAMLIDGFFRRVLAIGFLVALPPGIEALQDLYPELKRSCSSQDIVDNWTGLAMGLVIGLVLMIFIGLARLVRRRSERARRAGVVSDREAAGVHASGENAMNDEPLPLGGGRAGGYSDFEDFDDSPRSTRWWTQDTQQWIDDDASADMGASGATAFSSSEDRTRPVRSRRSLREVPDEAVDSTQVLPTYSRRDDGDSDTTQIIPRS